jgi:hypothetical protein
MSRWVVLKRRVGAVTSQRVLKVLFYVNILQCFFVVENFMVNAVSVAFSWKFLELTYFNFANTNKRQKELNWSSLSMTYLLRLGAHFQ